MKVFRDLNIQYYSTNIDKLNSSLKSKISNDNNIFDVFKQENISIIYKIEADERKIKDLFNSKNNIKWEIISDVSLNAGFYYPENKNDKLNLNIFSKNIDKLKSFYWRDNRNILYLLGPKGSSKSLFLIHFCVIFNIMPIPTLYINYKILKNLDEKKRKYIFKREIVYLFHDFERFKDFYNAKYHRLIEGEKDEFLHCLKEFIQTLLNIYENTFDENTILIIIDNFDEDNENLFSEMENLINLVNENSRLLNELTSYSINILIVFTLSFSFK